VLLGMGRQCLPEAGVKWLASLRRGVDDWRQMLESLGALYVDGYEVNWAGLDADYARRRLVLPTYPFQRKRYWKSALPVVPRREEAAPTEMDDSLYVLQWQSEQRVFQSADTARAHAPGGRWIVFCDRGGVGDRIAAFLERRNQTPLCVRPSERCDLRGEEGMLIRPDQPEDYACSMREVFSDNTRPVTGIIYLWGLDAAVDEDTLAAGLDKLQLFATGSLLHLVQALARERQSPRPRLWVATGNAQAEGPGPVSVAQAPLWGFGRAMAHELPDVWGGCVDFSAAAGDEEIEAFLLDVLQPDHENQIVYRGRRRCVARLVRPTPPAPQKGLCCSRDATYLITGGLGGVGMHIARELVRRNAGHLVLMGRSGLTDSAQAVLQEIEQMGAEVVVFKGDASRRQDVAKVLAHISSALPPLRGIVHAAGTVHDGVVLNLSWRDFLDVMAPKVSGAWNLHALTREMTLDFFVLCSSMAALAGSPGQANYAAANAFLDGLAHYRSALGLPAVSINWGAWADVGMTRALGGQDATRRAEMGIDDIEPQDGERIFGRLAGGGLTQAAILPIRWATFFRQFRQDGIPPLFAVIHAATAARSDSDSGGPDELAPSLAESVRGAPAGARSDLVFEHIRQRLIQVLRLDLSQPVDFQKGLTEIGMDSLMAVELRNLLQSDFNKPIPVSAMFECPTLRALADFIIAEFFADGPQPVEEPRQQTAADKALAEMSEDEAEISLLDELNRRGF
jgi:acyl transferase domain-containing protein